MDTVTILKTMRAIVADEPAVRLNMWDWFDRDTDCGCIIGLSIAAQPMLAKALGLRLKFGRGADTADLIHAKLITGVMDLSPLLGLSPQEAEWLFNFQSYHPNARTGEAGKAEALGRLDLVIAKYTPAVEPERATPRLSEQTA